MPGVADVKIDFPNRKATCSVDDGKFNKDEALAVLNKRFANTTIAK